MEQGNGIITLSTRFVQIVRVNENSVTYAKRKLPACLWLVLLLSSIDPHIEEEISLQRKELLSNDFLELNEHHTGTVEEEIDRFFQTEITLRQQKLNDSVQSTTFQDHKLGSPSTVTNDQLTTESTQGDRWETHASVPVDDTEPHDRTNSTEVNISTILDQFLLEDNTPSQGMSAVQPVDTLPVTTTALCKYRWSKSINTNSSDVGFYSSFSPKDPVLLTWDEQAEAYYSDNVRIVCGDYHGNLVFNGNIYPVEEFSVRSYTFEVDLYTKEDSSNLHSDQEIKSLKYEDLLNQKLANRDQMKGKVNNHDSQPAGQSCLLPSKRDSPIGDVDAEKYHEFNTEREITDRLIDSHKVYTRDSVEKIDSKLKDMDFIEDVLGRPPSAPLAREGEMTTLKRSNSFSGSRPSSAGSASTYNLQQDSSSQVLNRLSYPQKSCLNSALLGRSDIRTELSSLDMERQTSITNGRLSSSPIQSPVREASTLSPQGSKIPSSRSTPQDLLADQLKNDAEKSASQLSNRPPSNPGLGSRPPSIVNLGSRPPSSAASSRPSSRSALSIGSEKELSQYLEGRDRDKGSSLLPPEATKDLQLMSGVSEADRASSLPNYQQSQHIIKLEGRSITPDNRIRVPPAELANFRTGLVTERMEDVLGRTSGQSSLTSMSRGSSRSATPLASDYGAKDTNALKIQDLEASVCNLRKLLTHRETEVHSLSSQIADLKDINRSLKEDLEHKNLRNTPSSVLQDSLEYKQLQREKEILASEVVVLREQIERLSKVQPYNSGRSSASSGITDYSPNSPHVLQRKIADLEAHIRDLQEVTESTTANLLRAEDKLKYLEEENKELKSRTTGLSDLQGGSEVMNLRVELRALREDYRSLKERNLQLTEENIRLMEGQDKISKDHEQIQKDNFRISSSLKSDDAIKHQQDYSRSNYKLEQSSSIHSFGAEKSSYSNYEISKSANERDHQYLAHNHSYENDIKAAGSNRLLQQRNSLESRSLHNHAKDGKQLDFQKSTVTNYQDRSRPDGEVSENLFMDRYLKKSSENKEREIGSSYLDKHYAAYKDGNLGAELRRREDYEDNIKENKKKYIKENSRDESRIQHNGPISSKDIFLSLQSRTRNWLNEVASGHKVKESSDNDSDSTEILVAGLENEHSRKKKLSADFKEKISNSATSSFVSKSKKDLTHPVFNNENKYISGNLDFHRYHHLSGHHIDAAGDDSDTATDILLAQDTAPRGTIKRRPSLGSDGTSSTLSDGDDDNVLRRRSKSVETSRSKESSYSRHSSSLPRGAPTARSVTSLDSMRGSAGLRSILPTPLVTQHNKAELTVKNVTSLLNSSLTQGLRPFAPHSIADIRIDDVVKFSRVGGKLTQGVVKYVGHLPGRSEAYLGVELDKDEGKHDGTFEGTRYFKCKPNKGVFVAFNKVVMAWAP